MLSEYILYLLEAKNAAADSLSGEVLSSHSYSVIEAHQNFSLDMSASKFYRSLKTLTAFPHTKAHPDLPDIQQNLIAMQCGA